MIEEQYGIALYFSDIRKIAQLNLHVKENNIKIDRMLVLEYIYKCHIREIDRENIEYGKRNLHRADLPNYISFNKSLNIQLKMIGEYWSIFNR